MVAVPQPGLSEFIWQTRYRDPDARPAELEIGDTWKRVANAVAAIEREPALWAEQFLRILQNFRFLPAGRILAGAGTLHRVTLCNCFVMGLIDDSIEGIFESLKEAALTMQEGGGIGYDFSTLRPRGTRARTTGMVASGPVSFMRVWDAMCATILSTGARRGAMMATLRCDHPDIEEFIDAKRQPGCLQHFNLSVLITNAFVEAVRNDAPWPLMFPMQELDGQPEAQVKRAWSGKPTPVTCVIRRTLRARDLWQRLCDSAYDCAEPGVLFIDRINAMNNLGYCETLSATNPCAEEPLPPFGACNLGSLNLPAFVLEPFTSAARFDDKGIGEAARLAVRFLDNVIEITRFPLLRQREQAHRSRRIGLGITGLADALAMLGMRYGDEAARAAAAKIMCRIRDVAYLASIELARERGTFPAFDHEPYAARPFIQSLPPAVQDGIRRAGIRNSHLLAIAPAGTISLLAGNVSSGIEPVFGIEALRRVRDGAGGTRDFLVSDYAYTLWRARQAGQAPAAPFAGRGSESAQHQLLMQAALQPHVDGAIAKTIRLATDAPRGSVSEILQSAYDLGLKGCTIFRDTSRPAVIRERPLGGAERAAEHGKHCCDLERESD
ncbi:MAG TPA: adenosylcobalamin-dependent ribonucleoside-diphosphate reductase [Steroidobacteraceae bacterium]|nr:adenosylcobalamin-dependent ribonucleoside-diphosphate reductase [Steroidobacteraceae bacterium]